MPDSSHRILVVEDDPKLSHTITQTLRAEGYEAIRCDRGEDALAIFKKDRTDAIILDLGLPDIDGLEVLERLRAMSRGVPILILTARDAVKDRVAGLEGGSDDYLVKPCSLPELLARLRALLRRTELGSQRTLSCADLEVDLSTRHATRAGQILDLSPREFDLLSYLVQLQGEVVTRSMLAADVWNYTSRATPIDNVVDVQISRLRDKLDKPFDAPLLETVRGVGFRLRPPP